VSQYRSKSGKHIRNDSSGNKATPTSTKKKPICIYIHQPFFGRGGGGAPHQHLKAPVLFSGTYQNVPPSVPNGLASVRLQLSRLNQIDKPNRNKNLASRYANSIRLQLTSSHLPFYTPGYCNIPFIL
jgi:hypothetical protein